MDDVDFNSTLEPTVKGFGQLFTQIANGNYAINDTFFKYRGREIYDFETDFSQFVSTAPCIGVRCCAVSALGTADLNPTRATF
jgi:hypothetical protein